jgi:hypothetical protein
MLLQRLGLVLREHEDAAQSGMQAVAEREINDAVSPPEGTAGFALSAVNGCRRELIPPARMTLIVFSCMEA